MSGTKGMSLRRGGGPAERWSTRASRTWSLSLAQPTAQADPVQEVVNKTSIGHHRTYQILFREHGSGILRGPGLQPGLSQSRRLGVCRDPGEPGGPGSSWWSSSRPWVSRFPSKRLANVVADWPGTETPQKNLHRLHHYDTTSGYGSAGGDDNASGMAGMLEAARVLTQCHFKATLRFIAFNAEEDEEKGSQEYVSTLPWDTNIAGVINLDMILRPAWGH